MRNPSNKSFSRTVFFWHFFRSFSVNRRVYCNEHFVVRFPNFEKRKKGGGFVSWRGKGGITMLVVPRTNSNYLLQRIESAETYKCVREAEMKGKEKLSVPFGSQLIGLISKAYELCLKHKDILRHGTLSVTRTLDRYQLQIPLKYYTYILLRKRN